MRVENIVFIIGVLTAIALMIWYIVGKSPTIEQLLVGLVIANLTFSFKIHGDIQEHLGEHKGYEKSEQRNTEKL